MRSELQQAELPSVVSGRLCDIEEVAFLLGS